MIYATSDAVASIRCSITVLSFVCAIVAALALSINGCMAAVSEPMAVCTLVALTLMLAKLESDRCMRSDLLLAISRFLCSSLAPVETSAMAVLPSTFSRTCIFIALFDPLLHLNIMVKNYLNAFIYRCFSYFCKKRTSSTWNRAWKNK